MKNHKLMKKRITLIVMGSDTSNWKTTLEAIQAELLTEGLVVSCEYYATFGLATTNVDSGRVFREGKTIWLTIGTSFKEPIHTCSDDEELTVIVFCHLNSYSSSMIIGGQLYTSAELNVQPWLPIKLDENVLVIHARSGNKSRSEEQGGFHGFVEQLATNAPNVYERLWQYHKSLIAGEVQPSPAGDKTAKKTDSEPINVTNLLLLYNPSDSLNEKKIFAQFNDRIDIGDGDRQQSLTIKENPGKHKPGDWKEYNYNCIFAHGADGIEATKDRLVIDYSSAHSYYDDMLADFTRATADGSGKQLAERVFHWVEKVASLSTQLDSVGFVKHRIGNWFSGLNLNLDSLRQGIKNRDTEKIEGVFTFWKDHWGDGFMKTYSPFTLLMQTWFMIDKKDHVCHCEKIGNKCSELCHKNIVDMAKKYFNQDHFLAGQKLDTLFKDVDFCPGNVSLPSENASLLQVLQAMIDQDRSRKCVVFLKNKIKPLFRMDGKENKDFNIFRFCLALDIFVFVCLKEEYPVANLVNSDKTLFDNTGISMIQNFKILEEIEKFKEWLAKISSAFDELKQMIKQEKTSKYPPCSSIGTI